MACCHAHLLESVQGKSPSTGGQPNGPTLVQPLTALDIMVNAICPGCGTRLAYNGSSPRKTRACPKCQTLVNFVRHDAAWPSGPKATAETPEVKPLRTDVEDAAELGPGASRLSSGDVLSWLEKSGGDPSDSASEPRALAAKAQEFFIDPAEPLAPVAGPPPSHSAFYRRKLDDGTPPLKAHSTPTGGQLYSLRAIIAISTGVATIVVFGLSSGLFRPITSDTRSEENTKDNQSINNSSLDDAVANALAAKESELKRREAAVAARERAENINQADRPVTSGSPESLANNGEPHVPMSTNPVQKVLDDYMKATSIDTMLESVLDPPGSRLLMEAYYRGGPRDIRDYEILTLPSEDELLRARDFRATIRQSTTNFYGRNITYDSDFIVKMKSGEWKIDWLESKRKELLSLT